MTMSRTRILAAALGLALAAGSALAVGSDDDSGSDNAGLQEVLDSAELSINAGSYDGAITALTAALSSNPDNADVLNLLGYAYRKSGDLAQSAQFYTAALTADPDHLGALEYQGELFIMLGDIAAAEANLARLTALCGTCHAQEELAEALAAAGS